MSDASSDRIARYAASLEPNDWITTDAAAELCGVTRKAILGRIQQGRLPATKVPAPGSKYGGNGTAVWMIKVLDLAKCENNRAKNHATANRFRPSVIYYARFADRIKIGMSVALRSRMNNVPCDELLATEPGGREVERARHAQFAEYQITGEWFRPHPALMEHISRLAAQEKVTPKAPSPVTLHEASASSNLSSDVDDLCPATGAHRSAECRAFCMFGGRRCR